MSRTLDELHKIREQIYHEEEELSKEEIREKIRKESEEFLRQHNLKLRRLEKKIIS